MLNLTDNHLKAIGDYVATMPTDFITVGSVVKIKNTTNSKNLKYVVVARKADNVKLVWKSTLTDKNSKVFTGAIISRYSFDLINLKETVNVPKVWLDLVAN